MFKTSFLSDRKLTSIGISSVGENVLISKKASFYNFNKIIIGNNVRIDDFCILSGKIIIGNYVHIAARTYLYGGELGIEIADFSNISSHCAIYAVTDDYKGEGMTNPLIPEKYKKTYQKKVILCKHVIVGTGSVILPGVILSEGTAVGAMTLINKDTKPFCIYAGIPAKIIGKREKKILELEKLMQANIENIESNYENGKEN